MDEFNDLIFLLMCEWHYSAAQVQFKCLYCEFFTLFKYCTMIPFIALLEYFLNKDFLLNSAVLNGIGCMF